MALSAFRSASDLRSQLVEQRLVGVGVDLAADQLLGAGDGDRRDLLAQFLAGAVASGLDLGERSGLLPVALFDRFVLGGVDDLRTAGFGLRDDLVRLVTGILEDFRNLLLGLRL